MYMPRGGFLLCFSPPPGAFRGRFPKYEGPLVGRRLPVRLQQRAWKMSKNENNDNRLVGMALPLAARGGVSIL